MISGGIWAFHFGYDNYGWPSMERAAQLIQNTGKWTDSCSIMCGCIYSMLRACLYNVTDLSCGHVDVDVIGLLETDAARPYIGNHDIASWLSERLKMYVDYGPGPKDHTWGLVSHVM